MSKKKKKEYVCKCHKITKQDFKDEVNNGISTFKELQKETKIGSKCSGCKKKNKKRFEKALEKREQKQEIIQMSA